jgi:DNA polymerase-3 subunit alpha
LKKQLPARHQQSELLRFQQSGPRPRPRCTEFSRYIEAGDEDAARGVYGTLLDIYGDRFYTELHTWQFMDADTDEKRRLNTLMTQINQAKVRFATEYGVQMVIVNDSHHARPEDWENKELNIRKNKSRNEDEVADDYGQKADHLMGEDELYLWMRRHGIADHIVAEAIKNSAAIADMCNTEITKTLDMPRLTKSELDDFNTLMTSCERGFKERVIDAGLDQAVYYARLEDELKLISEKGFCGYFNVVADYVKAAKTGRWAPYVTANAPRTPLLVGPGRGSAGGCLVAYLLGITNLDPIRYDLLFARFLTKGRKGFPDIDCDFPQSYRPGIKDYLSAESRAAAGNLIPAWIVIMPSLSVISARRSVTLTVITAVPVSS